MKNLTQSQKAAAFDVLLHWLKETQKEMDGKADLSTQEKKIAIFRAKADILESAIAIANEIASSLGDSQPAQALNMPPAGLDLSQHVGKTVRLWNNEVRLIEDGKRWFADKYYPIALTGNSLDPIFVTKGGFYLYETATPENVKTILP